MVTIGMRAFGPQEPRARTGRRRQPLPRFPRPSPDDFAYGDDVRRVELCVLRVQTFPGGHR